MDPNDSSEVEPDPLAVDETRLDSIDAAVASIEQPVIRLARYGHQNRRMIWAVSASIAVDIALTVILAVAIRETRDAGDQSKNAIRTSCESGNTFRASDLDRWQSLIALADLKPAKGAAGAARQQALNDFIAKVRATDVQRVCP